MPVRFINGKYIPELRIVNNFSKKSLQNA